jgi:predicted DNA-binding transcriptional regulator YafY
METNSGYGLIFRLKALRDLLREGEFTKLEICHSLAQYYQPNASGNRRLTRDIKALRAWGYSITVNHATHAYAIQEIPFINLSDENVQALALIRETFTALAPISLDVLPVLEKVAAALPASQRSIYDHHPPLSIHMKPAADYRPYLNTIRLLETAIEQGRKIRFVYPTLDGQQTITHVGVEPYELEFLDRHFYLLGFTPYDLEMLEFRVDRIENLEIMSGKASKHRKRMKLSFSYRLSERIARTGVSERFSNQRAMLQPDGSAIIQAQGYSPFRIIQELLRYGEQAELLGPADLRVRMGQVVEAMAALYRKEKDK